MSTKIVGHTVGGVLKAVQAPNGKFLSVVGGASSGFNVNISGNAVGEYYSMCSVSYKFYNSSNAIIDTYSFDISDGDIVQMSKQVNDVYALEVEVKAYSGIDGEGNDSITYSINGGSSKSSPLTAYLNSNVDGWVVIGNYQDEDDGVYIRRTMFLPYTIVTSGTTISSLNITGMSLYSSCLDGDTFIMCPNDVQVKIKDLEIGDKVLSMNPYTMQLEEVEVTYVGNPISSISTEVFTFEDGTQIKTIGNHRFWHKETESMDYIQDFPIGDHTVNSKGEFVALTSKESLDDNDTKRVYYLHNKYHNYFANGMMSGDKATKIMNFNN